MMSRPARTYLLLLVVAVAFGAARDARAVDPAAVPATSAPLLRLTFVEPGRRAQQAAPATLELTGEGQVRISSGDGSLRDAPPLPRAELSRFVDEIVRTHRLLEIDSRCPAVGLLSRRFSQVRDLQDLAAIQARLQNIVAISEVGGFQEAERLAQEGTAQLQQDQPRAAPFTVRELAMVRSLPDGAQFVQFYRDSAPQPTIVAVTRFPESTRRVSVFNGAQEIR